MFRVGLFLLIIGILLILYSHYQYTPEQYVIYLQEMAKYYSKEARKQYENLYS